MIIGDIKIPSAKEVERYWLHDRHKAIYGTSFTISQTFVTSVRTTKNNKAINSVNEKEEQKSCFPNRTQCISKFNESE